MNESSERNIITISAEKIILKEGDTDYDMYKILKGNVELYSGYGTEYESLLGIIGPGACFGEFGLLLHKPAPYTAIAYSDIIVYKVSEEKIGEFIRDNQTNVLQMMKSMANSMMTMQTHINQLNEELDEKNKINKRIVGRNKEMLKRYIYNV
jgi:CRP-like cAMP-binding protein